MGRKRHIENLDDYIEEALGNIRDDRATTAALLTDLIVELKKSPDVYDSHKALGQVAAKYVETLQRSNEQLVKITTLLSKKEPADETLSEDDKDSLFDIIQNQQEVK